MSNDRAAPPAPDFTVVVTSCDRHDLLKVTVDSFLTRTDQPPQEPSSSKTRPPHTRLAHQKP